jgi:hypothetical protein
MAITNYYSNGLAGFKNKPFIFVETYRPKAIFAEPEIAFQ